MTILNFIYQNLDVFLINYSVFIFGYNYLLKTTKNLNKYINLKNENEIYYEISDENNQENKIYPYDYDNFETKINKFYFMLGAICILIGSFLTILKNTESTFLAIIIFSIYLIIGIIISLIIKSIEKKQLENFRKSFQNK